MPALGLCICVGSDSTRWNRKRSPHVTTQIIIKDRTEIVACNILQYDKTDSWLPPISNILGLKVGTPHGANRGSVAGSSVRIRTTFVRIRHTVEVRIRILNKKLFILNNTFFPSFSNLFFRLFCYYRYQ